MNIVIIMPVDDPHHWLFTVAVDPNQFNRVSGSASGSKKAKNGPQEGRNLYLHFMYRIEELACFYVYSFLKVHLHHSSKIKSHKEAKKVEIKVFLNFFAY